MQGRGWCFAPCREDQSTKAWKIGARLEKDESESALVHVPAEHHESAFVNVLCEPYESALLNVSAEPCEFVRVNVLAESYLLRFLGEFVSLMLQASIMALMEPNETLGPCCDWRHETQADGKDCG